MNDILGYAIKLLGRKDYTVEQLRHKLAEKFEDIPAEVFDHLQKKRFLDDRRVAENLVRKYAENHRDNVRENLTQAGISQEIIDQVVEAKDWPSLRSVLKAKMVAWHLRAPLHRRDAARLFRTLSRLGFPEDEIREELEQLHEQQ